MADVIPFVPKFKTPADNLNAFIEHCRDILSIYEDQGGFKVDEWKTIGTTRPIAIKFFVYKGTKAGTNFTPLPEPYSLIAKSYIRYKQTLKESSAIRNEVLILQVLYEALNDIHGVGDILKINGLVQKKAVHILDKRYPGSDKLYRYGGSLEIFYDFLRKKGIAPALPVWKRPWKRGRAKAQRTDSESKKWQEERCPSMHQMLALADCFNRATSTQDLYWTSVITLLMFAPGRGSEPIDLTIDCLGQDGGHYYVSWISKKGFGANRKWVPEVLVEPVKDAIRRLIEIGKPAREAAKFAYENPGKFMRHPGCVTPQRFLEESPLNSVEFGSAMQLTGCVNKILDVGVEIDSELAWNYFRETKWIKKLRKEGPVTYGRLANYVQEKYRDNNWPDLNKTGRPIWESLLLHRENEFHSEFAVKQFSWRLPDVNELNDHLRRRVSPAIFERFGFKDEDGTEIAMTSHQPRVWLSTMSERGGMDSWQLAQWAGRSRIQDNAHYDLRTDDEVIAQSRAILVLTEAPTALEAIKLNLPVSYETLGIKRLGIAHPTLYGMCVHDYPT